MRQQFVRTLKKILADDQKSVLLLGDIGVFAFRDEIQRIPNRVINIGILEQAMIGFAAGLSKEGLIPFIHTIAPFLIERAFEQLKIDFGYQNLRGNFISVGASYDYAALGCTHHCPADIGLLTFIPTMQIIVPGTSDEFNSLMLETYNNDSATYYRLSETENRVSNKVSFGKGLKIKDGTAATVICYGNMLSEVITACEDLDVTILYYTTILPFDHTLLKENFNETIIICEPFYSGSTNFLITEHLKEYKYTIHNIGIPRNFIINYGTKHQQDEHLQLNSSGIHSKIVECLI